VHCPYNNANHWLVVSITSFEKITHDFVELGGILQEHTMKVRWHGKQHRADPMSQDA